MKKDCCKMSLAFVALTIVSFAAVVQADQTMVTGTSIMVSRTEMVDVTIVEPCCLNLSYIRLVSNPYNPQSIRN